jgi:amino acid transporter
MISHKLIAVIVVFLAASGSFAGLAIKDRRPRESLDTPLIPTTPLLLLSGVVALVALVILVNLAGAHFRPQP